MSSCFVWKIKDKNTGLFLSNTVKGKSSYNKYGKLFNKKHLAEKSLSKLGVDDHEIVEFVLQETSDVNVPENNSDETDNPVDETNNSLKVEEDLTPEMAVSMSSSWDDLVDDDEEDEEDLF